MSEILNLSSLCRCCHADGNFKSLGFAYNGADGIEMFGKMLEETFKIMLSPPPINASYAICEDCVTKLREAYRFKHQVLSCEEKFQLYCQNELSNVTVKVEYESEIKHGLEEKSSNLTGIDEDLSNHNDDDNYNEDLNHIDTNDESKHEEPKNKATKTAKKPKVIMKRPRGRPKKKKLGIPKKIRDPLKTRKSIDKTEPLHVVNIPLSLPFRDVTVPANVTVPLNDVTVSLNDVTVPLKDVTVPLNDDDIKIDTKVKDEVDEALEGPKIEDVAQEATPLKQDNEKVQFKCNYEGCNKVFLTMNYLKRHRRVIHSDSTSEKVEAPLLEQARKKPQHKCNHEGCDKVFFNKKFLKKHRKAIHSDRSDGTLERGEIRTLIDEVLRSVSPISEVIKNETGDLIACLACGHTFQNNKQLNVHLSKEHGGTMKCPKCKKFFKGTINLRAHIAKIHLKTSLDFKCEKCEKAFPNKYALKNHQNLHTKKRKFICDICNAETLHRSAIVKHILSHYGSIKKFFCDKCGRGFNDGVNFRIHIQTVHEKLRKYECHLCEKKMSTRKGLKAHVLRHQGVVPFNKNLSSYENLAPFDKKCEVCSESFVDRFKYKNHVRKHKRSERKHKCDYCNKAFGSRYLLKRHLDTHSGEKKFSCPICPAQFTQKCKIPVHVRNVHNKPNFEKIKCAVCNKFYDEGNIEKHRKGHEIKPYACDMCDKRYPSKNALNKHIKWIHSSETRKHECNICDKSYRDKSKLRMHLKKKHSIEETKVEIEIDNYDTALPTYAIRNIVPYSVDIEKA